MFLAERPRRILAYRDPVDMRKSFDGLVALVKSVLEEDPLSGTLFVFFNRRGNDLKLVTWDRTGFCLFAKLLEILEMKYWSSNGASRTVEFCIDFRIRRGQTATGRGNSRRRN
ncbi:MAG: IS66 family insertion sequence element accessory protein TnpB [Acidobacteriota bacterium]|nr:IS66 family insertion sequence element accessory protein TnpB [Acidobacteriota bacterium]